MNNLAYAVHHLVVGRQVADAPLSPLEHAVLTDLQVLLQRPPAELESLFTLEIIPEWIVLPSMLGAETSPV